MQKEELEQLRARAFRNCTNVMAILPSAFGAAFLIKDKPVALNRFSWFLSATLVPYSVYSIGLAAYYTYNSKKRPPWELEPWQLNK